MDTATAIKLLQDDRRRAQELTKALGKKNNYDRTAEQQAIALLRRVAKDDHVPEGFNLLAQGAGGDQQLEGALIHAGFLSVNYRTVPATLRLTAKGRRLLAQRSKKKSHRNRKRGYASR